MGLEGVEPGGLRLVLGGLEALADEVRERGRLGGRRGAGGCGRGAGVAALGAAGFPLPEVWGLQAVRVRARTVAAAVVSRVIVWCVRIAPCSPGLDACVVDVTGL